MCKGELDGTHLKNGGCRMGGARLQKNHPRVPQVIGGPIQDGEQKHL